MKVKFIALLLIIAMITSFAACSSSTEDEQAVNTDKSDTGVFTEESQTPKVTETTAESTDESVTESTPTTTTPPVEPPDWVAMYRNLMRNKIKDDNDVFVYEQDFAYGGFLYDIDGDGIPELFLIVYDYGPLIVGYTSKSDKNSSIGVMQGFEVYKLPNQQGIYIIDRIKGGGYWEGSRYYEFIDGKLTQRTNVGELSLSRSSGGDDGIMGPDGVYINQYSHNGTSVSESEFNRVFDENFNSSTQISAYERKDMEKMFSDWLANSH